MVYSLKFLPKISRCLWFPNGKFSSSRYVSEVGILTNFDDINKKIEKNTFLPFFNRFEYSS